ncbi:hypothetical protein NX023_10270 [Cytobacillus firmus]|nr:hypothetical protein [Cytobacillus firmus]
MHSGCPINDEDRRIRNPDDAFTGAGIIEFLRHYLSELGMTK